MSWTKGVIVSNHKKGDKSNPANYRGITLINITAKIFPLYYEIALTNGVRMKTFLKVANLVLEITIRRLMQSFFCMQLFKKYLTQRKNFGVRSFIINVHSIPLTMMHYGLNLLKPVSVAK